MPLSGKPVDGFRRILNRVAGSGRRAGYRPHRHALITERSAMDFEQLHHDVAFDKAGGKIIWQPRIECWYDDRRFAGIPFPDEFQGLSRPDIYRKLGCSARIYAFNGCFEAVPDSRIETERVQLSSDTYEIRRKTPVGTIHESFRVTPSSWAEKRESWPVKDADDLRVMGWIQEHTDWRFNPDTFDRVRTEWAGLGAPTIFMPRINVQHLYIDIMGVSEGVYMLYDEEDAIDRYFQILHENHLRMIEVINRSPIDIINFGDNVHSGTLSPELFERYALPVFQDRSEKLHAAGKFTFSHWDGDTRPLLRYARETGMDGIEAITPKPQGDVDLEEVKEALGDMYLIDGIAAILFDPLYTVEQLLEQAQKVIDLFAPHLILGISDEISSTGELERIRDVGKLVDDYNARVSAAG